MSDKRIVEEIERLRKGTGVRLELSGGNEVIGELVKVKDRWVYLHRSGRVTKHSQIQAWSRVGQDSEPGEMRQPNATTNDMVGTEAMKPVALHCVDELSLNQFPASEVAVPAIAARQVAPPNSSMDTVASLGHPAEMAPPGTNDDAWAWVEYACQRGEALVGQVVDFLTDGALIVELSLPATSTWIDVGTSGAERRSCVTATFPVSVAPGEEVWIHRTGHSCVRATLPVSELAEKPIGGLAQYVCERFMVKVISIDRLSEKVIVSQRALRVRPVASARKRTISAAPTSSNSMGSGSAGKKESLARADAVVDRLIQANHNRTSTIPPDAAHSVVRNAFPGQEKFGALSSNWSPSAAGVPGGDSPYSRAKRAQLIRKDLAEAERLFKEAIRVHDRRASAIKDLANIYLQLKRNDDAISLLEDFLKSSERPEERSTIENHLVQVYQASGRHDHAVRMLDGMIERSRGNRLSILWRLKILSLARGKGIDSAEQALRPLKRRYPHYDWVDQLIELLNRWRQQPEESADQAEFLASPPMSAMCQHALSSCKFMGLDAKTIQTQQYTYNDVIRLRDLAGRAGTRRPRELAEYYLTAAAVNNEIDNDKYDREIRQDLRQYFAFLGEAHLLNEESDAARVSYAESLRLAIGTPYKDEAQFLRLLCNFARAWLSGSTLTIPQKAERARYEEILGQCFLAIRDQGSEDLQRSIAYLFLVSPTAAERFWNFVKDDKNLYATFDSDIRENWSSFIRHVKESYEKVRGEFRHFEKLDLEALDDEHQIEIEEPCLIDLDRTRIRTLREIHTEVADLLRHNAFEEQERLFNRIMVDCDQLLMRIQEQPTPLGLEEVKPWVEMLKNRITARFREIQASSTPSLSVRLPVESVCPDEEGKIELQIEVQNQFGCAPASEVDIEIRKDSRYFICEEEPPPHPSLRGGEKATFRLPLRVTRAALNSQTFPIGIGVIGEDRSHEAVGTDHVDFSIRLYSSSDFRAIHNPYRCYAAGTPVGVDDEKMFFGRQDLIEKLTDLLIDPGRQSSTVVLYGQKRSGKTSILEHLRPRLSFPILPIQFSLGDIVANLSLPAFLYRIIEKLEEAMEDHEDLEPPPVEFPRREDIKAEPSLFITFMEKFTRACSRSAKWHNCRIVLLIDEFTYLYDAVQRGTVSDDFMRTWKALVEKRFFRSVLVGQDFMHRLKDRFPNEFGVTKDLRVTYLQEEHARQLIDEPTRIPTEAGTETRFRGDAIARIVQLTAGSPYFLQIFCDRLIDYMNEKRSIYCTHADVERVKDTLVRGIHALDYDKFESLIRAGDETDEYKENVLNIVRAIAAKATAGWCASQNLTGLPRMNDSDREALLKDLVNRDVLEKKAGSNAYRIRVGLFHEWLTAH